MLPEYTPSPTPIYTSSPSSEEQRIEYTPRYPGTEASASHGGSFVKKWKHATIILKEQDVKEPLPCYGRNSIVHGELGLDDMDITSVSLEFEGRLMLSISDVGATEVPLVRERYILWKRGDNESSRCPSVIPFSIRIPATFQDGNETKKLPPTYEAIFHGVPSFSVTSTYTLKVIVTRLRPRYGLWMRNRTYTLRLNYRPRSRPGRPITRCESSIFSMVKYIPEEWHQIMTTMESRPGSGVELIHCHFLIPSVQAYALEDTIPFFIQLSGPLASLSHLFPRGDEEDQSDKLAIRVCLLRRTLVTVYGRNHWRSKILASGKVWPTPPPLGSRTDDVSADWEGEIQCSPDVRTSSFNIGSVAVQDYLLFALTPTDARNCPLRQLQHAHPIKLVTDIWSEDDNTTHPQDTTG